MDSCTARVAARNVGHLPPYICPFGNHCRGHLLLLLKSGFRSIALLLRVTVGVIGLRVGVRIACIVLGYSWVITDRVGVSS